MREINEGAREDWKGHQTAVQIWPHVKREGDSGGCKLCSWRKVSQSHQGVLEPKLTLGGILYLPEMGLSYYPWWCHTQALAGAAQARQGLTQALLRVSARSLSITLSKLSALVKCIIMVITDAKRRQFQTIGTWMCTVCLCARGIRSCQSGRLSLQPAVRCHHQGFLGEVREQGKVRPWSRCQKTLMLMKTWTNGPEAEVELHSTAAAVQGSGQAGLVPGKTSTASLGLLRFYLDKGEFHLTGWD